MRDTTKKILEKIGLGGAIAGIAGFNIVISILEIIFVWGTGVTVAWMGISLILEGSILWGFVVLFIGTPIAIAIASFLFPIWLIILVIWGIIWLIGRIF